MCFRYPDGYFEQQYDFDFFNYAGIHRSVFLYATPRSFVDDITLTTDITFSSGSPVEGEKAEGAMREKL